MKILSTRTKYTVQKLSRSSPTFHDDSTREITGSELSLRSLSIPFTSVEDLLIDNLPPSPRSPSINRRRRTNSHQQGLQGLDDLSQIRKSTQTDPLSDTASIILPSPAVSFTEDKRHANPKTSKKKNLVQKLISCFKIKKKKRVLEVNLDDFSSVSSSDDAGDKESHSSSFRGKPRGESFTSDYEICSAASFYSGFDGNRSYFSRSSKSSATSGNSNPSAVEEKSCSTQNDATSRFTMSLDKESEDHLLKMINHQHESKKIANRLALSIPENLSIPAISLGSDSTEHFDALSDVSSIESPNSPKAPQRKKAASLSRYSKSYLPEKKYQPPPSYPPVPRLPSNYVSRSNSSSSCDYTLSPSSPLVRPISQPLLPSDSSYAQATKAQFVARYNSTSVIENRIQPEESSQLSTPTKESYPLRVPLCVRNKSADKISANSSEADLTSNPSFSPNIDRKQSYGIMEESFYDLNILPKSMASLMEFGKALKDKNKVSSSSLDSINYSAIYNSNTISGDYTSYPRNSVQNESGIRLMNKHFGLASSASNGSGSPRNLGKRMSNRLSLKSVDSLGKEDLEQHNNQNGDNLENNRNIITPTNSFPFRNGYHGHPIEIETNF